MTIKITSPIAGLNHETEVGPLALVFKEGVAKVNDLSDGARAYLLSNGYTVDGESVDQPEPEIPLDSRDASEIQIVGTPLRDAAVDPQPGDFLAPTNAGQADPHGPDVVSPEVHASQGVRPVKGGEVHVDDPAKQDAAETEHAAAATDGTPIVVLDSEKEPVTTPDHGVLKGAALDEALDDASLPKTGTADEKRARLAEYQANQV